MVVEEPLSLFGEDGADAQDLSELALGNTIKSRFVVEKNKISRRIVVDLMSATHVNGLLLWVEKNSNTPKFRVQVWAVRPDAIYKNGFRKTLVHYKNYSNSTWFQFGTLAHETANLQRIYPNPNAIGLQALGLTGLNVRTR